MPAHAHRTDEDRTAPVTVPPAQRADVRALSEFLARLGHGARRGSSRFTFEGRRGEKTAIPASVLAVLERAVEALARGEAVSVVPVSLELTTQDAADLLSVSRQYLVRLVESGTIPCAKTGAHRRLRVQDVLAYQRRRDRERKRSLDKLAQLSQDFGGYDELRR